MTHPWYLSFRCLSFSGGELRKIELLSKAVEHINGKLILKMNNNKIVFNIHFMIHEKDISSFTIKE